MSNFKQNERNNNQKNDINYSASPDLSLDNFDLKNEEYLYTTDISKRQIRTIANKSIATFLASTATLFGVVSQESLASSDPEDDAISAKMDALSAQPWNIDTAIEWANVHVFVGNKIGKSRVSREKRLFTNRAPYNTRPLQILNQYEAYLRSYTNEINADPSVRVQSADRLIDPFSRQCSSNTAIGGIVKYRLDPKNKNQIEVKSSKVVANTEEEPIADDFNGDGVSSSFTVACNEKNTYKLIIGGMIADKKRSHFIAGRNKHILLDTTKLKPTEDIRPTKTKVQTLQFYPNKDKTRPRMLISKLIAHSRFHPMGAGTKQFEYVFRKPNKSWKTVDLAQGSVAGNNVLGTRSW